MKNLIIIIVAGIIVTACGKPKTEPVNPQSEMITDSIPVSSENNISDIQLPEMLKPEENKETETAKTAFSTTAIVRSYLNLKNTLTQDNSKAAANAGKMLHETLQKTDINSLDSKEKSLYTEIAESIGENAEHIAANATNIVHQREHFDMLSKDVSDLIDTFGSEGKLYKDFCPMYNDNKGAIWISEKKEIINPYMGKEMLSCGSVQKEL